MNVEKINKELEKKRDDKRNKKCEPVASKIIEAIGKFNPPTKDMPWEESVKAFAPLGSEINRIMKEAGLTIAEVNYTWSIVQAVLDTIKRMSSDAIQSAFNIAQSRWLGVDNPSELTLQNLDNMLQSK